MSYQPFDYNDPEDEIRRQAFQAEIEALEARAGDKLDDDLRKLGCYVQNKQIAQIHSPFGPKPAVIVTASLGEIPFRTRTQDPETDGIDRQFRDMAAAAEVDGFLEARKELEDKLGKGEDPYGLEA